MCNKVSDCWSGCWWEVCLQVRVWPRGSLLHGLPWQPEAQSEGGSREPAWAGRRDRAPCPLRWRHALPAGCWGAGCGGLPLPRQLQLLTRCTKHSLNHSHAPRNRICHIPEEELFAPPPLPSPPPHLSGGFTWKTLKALQINISKENCADIFLKVTSEETAVVMTTPNLRTDVYFV